MSGGIEIAKRALAAQKYAMDVIGQNVANVNTAGYSRQQIQLAASDPTTVPVMNATQPIASVGTGVNMIGVTRVRDEFLDSQRRDITQKVGQWDQSQTNYSIVEGIFNEPSDTAISGNLNRFWNSWQSLAAPDPSNAGARSNLVSQGQVLADSLKQTRQQLLDLQGNTDKDVQVKVKQINDLASQIATLNGKIIEASATGSPNDLLDQRNNLVSQLSQLVNIDYYTDSHGSSTIAIGGSFLVSNRDANLLTTQPDVTNHGYSSVLWQTTGQKASVSDGELFGLLNTRDTTLNKYIGDMNTFASALITQVNAVHQTGYGLNGSTGLNFFTGTDGSDISVNQEIVDDPTKIAASTSAIDPQGNGENATAIGNVRTSLVMDSGSSTIDQYYQNVISDIGTGSSEAQTYLKTNQSLQQQIDQQINSVSGVSIDEEMTNMIKAQQAYGAAAKYMSMVQGTLDTLMGLLR